ncbi:MAG: ATP-dependent Clp protease proteolytic subunit [Planctomycetota bacterium]|nr:ATP-dependent Clp protease proteolytic subunit [Planctomycetota bacterium]MDA1214673.1 ATP-dependent Clp protease proteolytic subunit [Planctomycetota bacterium]
MIEMSPVIPSKPLFGIFCSPIDDINTQRFANNFAFATQQGYTELHISFQTIGGNVCDGVFLYNLLRQSPVPVIFYNIGTVHSAGTIAYLGASKRVVNKHGLFMIHSSRFSLQNSTSSQFEAISKLAGLEDRRIEAIFSEAVRMKDIGISDIQNKDVWIECEEALRAGIAHEIGDFAPPPGAKIFSFTAL